jgi:murein DD-endopeptidase MepM/ murein hydrolase activator NlpD
MKQLFSVLLICLSSMLFAQEGGTPMYHVVVPGNTLYGIATANKVPVEVVRKWNNMTNYSIKVGQKLIVGYEKPDAENTDAPQTSPPVQKPVIAETKPIVVDTAKSIVIEEPVKQVEEKEIPKPEVVEIKPEPKKETIEDLGFNVSEVDTTVAPSVDLTALFPSPSDSLMNNLIFCGGVDDDRPVGISSVFFNNALGKNYVYVFIEKDTVFNVRTFIVDLYTKDEAGAKTKLSTTNYELKPKWKYTIFKHYIENPGLYEVVVFDRERKRLGDGQVRILSK